MMQRILFYLALMISFITTLSSCSEKTAYIVAEQSGGNEMRLTDISKAKNYFKKVLEHAKVQEEPGNFEIVNIKGAGDSTVHLLRANTNAKNSYIAIEIFEAGKGQLGITSQSLTQGVLICNSACSQGCLPVKSKGQWSCSNACDGTTICQEIITRAYEENNYTTPIQAFLEKY